MWIYTADGFYSVVRKGRALMVRSRVEGDLEKLFPEALHDRIKRTPEADYLFRIAVDRRTFEAAMVKAMRGIDYPNFKDAVHEKDEGRCSFYTRVWAVMFEMQNSLRWKALKGKANAAETFAKGFQART